MLLTLRAGAQNRKRWRMTRSPMGSLGLDLALGRETNRGARASPRGSPTPAGASRREIEVKKDMFVVDIQSAMELAKLKLNNGLKELAIIAPTTREAVVAVAGQNMPKFMERPFLLEMGVPKDCIDKVIKVYQSSFGHILSRDTGRDGPTRQNDRRNRGG